ncbi:sensor histidine kinase, partial [Paenibacillus sp.]|uniref:sensor histidine kinase n=1 Tax=Paenibacillus sp. TaxID=58172 RepID=UPI003463CF29
MNKYPIVFVRDRLLYLLASALIIGLGTSLMLLKQAKYPEAMDDGTIVYFIVLSLLFVVLWLVVDYIRQKNYYKELMQVCTDSNDVNAAILVQSPITREQMLVADVLERQHRIYLNELGAYRRQQEMHNHFVLQWVHQMKTPISAADMLCQEAMQQIPISKGGQRQLAASIQEEMDRMSRSLELLLYTARLDKFEMDLHIRRIPLHDLVRSVVNGHKRLCIRHSTFPLIEGEAWVETDE